MWRETAFTEQIVSIALQSLLVLSLEMLARCDSTGLHNPEDTSRAFSTLEIMLITCGKAME